jgi:hypothetical protein
MSVSSSTMGWLLCAFSLFQIDDGLILGASSKFRDRTYFQNTSQLNFFENRGSCGAFWMNPLVESGFNMVTNPHTNFGRQLRGSYGRPSPCYHSDVGSISEIRRKWVFSQSNEGSCISEESTYVNCRRCGVEAPHQLSEKLERSLLLAQFLSK